MRENEKILSELGYPEKLVPEIAGDLSELSPQLSPLWDAYRANHEDIRDYSFAGHSIMGLMRDRGFNFVAAILTMDWLLKDPSKASELINQEME